MPPNCESASILDSTNGENVPKVVLICLQLLYSNITTLTNLNSSVIMPFRFPSEAESSQLKV